MHAPLRLRLVSPRSRLLMLLFSLAPLLAGCSITVADSVLSKGVTSYWLWTEDEPRQTVFSTKDEKITLHVKFDYNIVAQSQVFRATWYEPGGLPYVAGGIRTPFGNNDSLIVSLKIAGTTAERKPGKWRVKVHYGADELVEREFELREP